MSFWCVIGLHHWVTERGFDWWPHSPPPAERAACIRPGCRKTSLGTVEKAEIVKNKLKIAEGGVDEPGALSLPATSDEGID